MNNILLDIVHLALKKFRLLLILMFNNKSLENKPNPCCHKEIKKQIFLRQLQLIDWRAGGRLAS